MSSTMADKRGAQWPSEVFDGCEEGRNKGKYRTFSDADMNLFLLFLYLFSKNNNFRCYAIKIESKTILKNLF